MIRYRTLKRDFYILKLVGEANLTYKEIALQFFAGPSLVDDAMRRYRRNKKFYIEQIPRFFQKYPADFFNRLE